MPAIAWRLIDFLNYRGTESEGLYRISGGHQDIKKYMQRFDTGKIFHVFLSLLALTPHLLLFIY